jgi:murein L,D-transpeptidase YcbB/YkuD
VGKRYRKTPVFSTTIEQVTINPRWGVPPRLAVQDLLPEIKRDITTLERKHLRVIDARTGARVDPSTVPWSKLHANRFPYILQQEPGPDNALGRFKLVMPNAYDVYLHDTPKRHLFAEDQRAFSSGCVRLQHPRDLTVALLRGHPKWTATKLDSAVSDGKELTIRLPKPVPVHLLYWTAFVDADGRLQLRRDVYSRDAALRAALAEDAERPSPP